MHIYVHMKNTQMFLVFLLQYFHNLPVPQLKKKIKNNIHLINAGYWDTHINLQWKVNDPDDESPVSLWDLLYSTCWNLIRFGKTEILAAVSERAQVCVTIFFSNALKKRKQKSNQSPTLQKLEGLNFPERIDANGTQLLCKKKKKRIIVVTQECKDELFCKNLQI